MGEYPNVRERLDVNPSKSRYFTDKMAAPFGPFYISTPNPASKTGLLLSCLGTVGVFPSSLLCHLGMFSGFPPFYFLGAKDMTAIHMCIQQL